MLYLTREAATLVEIEKKRGEMRKLSSKIIDLMAEPPYRETKVKLEI